MVEKQWVYDEIVVEVTGLFTTHHTFRSGAETLAVLDVPAGMAEGSYQGRDGRRMVVRRTGCLSRCYELWDSGVVRGAAEPRGLFKQGYALRFDGHELELVPEGAFRQGWWLVNAEGHVLLSLGPRGVFKRGARLVAPYPIEFPLAVMAYYLYQVIQQEMAAVVTAV